MLPVAKVFEKVISLNFFLLTTNSDF